MTCRKLTPTSDGSCRIILDRGDLKLDGVVNKGGNVKRRNVRIRRTDRGHYELIVLGKDGRPLDSPRTDVAEAVE